MGRGARPRILNWGVPEMSGHLVPTGTTTIDLGRQVGVEAVSEVLRGLRSQSHIARGCCRVRPEIASVVQSDSCEPETTPKRARTGKLL